MTQETDLIKMARAAKSLCSAAAEDETPLPSDECFIRAAVAFSMLMRRSGELAVIRAKLDPMMLSNAIATIALNYDDNPPSTPERAALFATVLPDDYANALEEAVAGNRRALGLPPQTGDKP